MSEPRLDTRHRGERSLADWHNAIAFYRRLSAEGLSPEIARATDAELVTHWYPSLLEWLAGQAGVRRDVGLTLLRRVNQLHSHGVCHRDLHDGNVVVRDGLPLFIDLEFAIATDPERPCYDLYGPAISGVPVPRRHAEQLGSPNANGVWWDNAAHTTLASIFGTVSELESAL